MSTDRLRTAGRHARSVQCCRSFVAALTDQTDTSRFGTYLNTLDTTLRNAWRVSTAESGATFGLARSRSLLAGSVVVATGQSVAGPLVRATRAAIDRATVTALATETEHVVRSSWLYRWLTADPEPEVIVIDLRETLSVGPVNALLDQIIQWRIPASRRSTIIESGTAVHAAVRDAPVRAASLVLGIAVLTNSAITLGIGEPTEVGIIARIVLLGLAALGTRVSMPWDELVETRPVLMLITALEPPEPPEKFDEQE